METENINLTLPIRIPFPVMLQLLDNNLIGMEIGTGNRKQGKILRTSIGASPLPDFDIVLGLRLELTRKLLWAKEVPVYLHGSLNYNAVTGILAIGAFKIDSKSKNFLLDKALEILANRMYYRKILDKASFNLYDFIHPRLPALNQKLETGMPVGKGMVLYGSMDNITIPKIEPLPDHILVYALFKGTVEVTIQEIPDLDFGL